MKAIKLAAVGGIIAAVLIGWGIMAHPPSSSPKTLHLNLPASIDGKISGSISGTASGDSLLIEYSDNLDVDQDGKTLNVSPDYSGPAWIRFQAVKGNEIEASAKWNGPAG